MLQKLRTIIYHTDDLKKATAWYAELTGTQPYFDEPFYVGFDINGFELGLDPEPATAGNHTVCYWHVEDINTAVAKAMDLNASLISPVTNVGGTIETAIVQDPFGNHIGFITGA